MQTFLEGKATAQEKMLKNNYEVPDNEFELAQQTSITPSEILSNTSDNQGVKLVEAREKLKLNDRQTV